MPQNCTIYCKIPNGEEIATLVHSLFAVEVPKSDLSYLVQGIAGTLQVSQMYFREPFDDFSRLILSTRAFAERVPSSDKALNKKLMNDICLTKLAVGIVAEPGFDADERYHALVFSISKHLNGLIFNGFEFLDADGQPFWGN